MERHFWSGTIAFLKKNGPLFIIITVKIKISSVMNQILEMMFIKKTVQ